MKKFTVKQAQSDDPVVLAEILGRDEPYDQLSELAAKNPMAPASALGVIVSRCEDNWTTKIALKNKNCPSEALGIVLRRMKPDEISRLASQHANSKIADVLRWRVQYPEETGRKMGVGHAGYLPPEQSDEPDTTTFSEFIGKP